MDNYNGTQSPETSNNHKRLLEIIPRKDKRCVWCISYSLQQGRKEAVGYNPTSERQIPSSSGQGRECDSNSRGTLGVRELRGDECLDFYIPVEDKSSHQFSNTVIKNGGNDGAMPKLQSLSDLVDAVKNDRKFREFHEPTDKWMIDQENKKHFSDAFGITNIHPLFAGCYGMVLLFLDDRGILFSWCEMTFDMDILGFNIMEGLANFVYHPEKKFAIIEDTGELITEVELGRRVMKELEATEPLVI